MGSPPLLTVVVPFGQSSEQLKTTLDSILQQSHSHLEVLVVDDGSSAESKKLCDELGDDDPRLVVLGAKSAAAKNVGAERARGEYLCFVDSGEIVQPQAFETLLNSAVRGKAQIATGTIDLISDGQSRRCWQHQESRGFAVRAKGLDGFPALVLDTTVSNKIFRRDFFDEIKAVFAGNTHADELGLMLELMLGASRLEVLPSVVIRRPEEDDAASFADAIAGIDRGMEILAERGSRESLGWYYWGVFEEELFDYGSQLLCGDEEFDEQYAEVVRRLWPANNPELVDDLSLARRAFYAELVKSGPQPARDLSAWCSNNEDLLPARLSGDKLIVDSGRIAEKLPVLPDWVWSLARESRVEYKFASINWLDGKLRLRGWAYIRHDESTSGQSVEIAAIAANGKRLGFIVDPSTHPEIFAHSTESRTADGFEAWLDPRIADNLDPGSYVFELTVRSGGLTRSTRTTGVLSGGSLEGLLGESLPQWRRGQIVGSDVVPLGLQIAQAFCVAKSVVLDGRDGVVTFDVAPGLEPRVGTFKHDKTQNACPAKVTKNDDGSFTLRGNIAAGHGRGWYTRLPVIEMAGGKKFQVDMPHDCEISLSGESGDLYPLRSRHGRVTIVDRRGLVLVDEIQILAGERISLAGTAGPQVPLEFGVHVLGKAPSTWARASHRGWEFEVVLEMGAAMDLDSTAGPLSNSFGIQVREVVEKSRRRPDRPWWLCASLECAGRLPKVSRQGRQQFEATGLASRELRVTMTPFPQPR